MGMVIFLVVLIKKVMVINRWKGECVSFFWMRLNFEVFNGGIGRLDIMLGGGFWRGWFGVGGWLMSGVFCCWIFCFFWISFCDGGGFVLKKGEVLVLFVVLMVCLVWVCVWWWGDDGLEWMGLELVWGKLGLWFGIGLWEGRGG